MSTINEVPVTSTQTSHADIAQERVAEVRAMREKIPNLLIPDSPGANRRLISAATVSPEFIELSAVAVKNSESLVRKGGADPEQTRDLMSYAEAYSPLADELEALAQFIRHSVIAARHKAGSNALTTYAMAQVLAGRPETADLAPHVADMRRALGKRALGRVAKPKPVPTLQT